MPRDGFEMSTISASSWMKSMNSLMYEGFQLKLKPQGTSMIPFVRGGRDEVILRSFIERKPVRGDIVLFSRDDGLHVLHRVHHVKNNSYYMLGDAQTLIEGPVKEEFVLAVVEAVVWNGKTIRCNRIWLRFLAITWLILRPFRPYIFRQARWAKRIYNKVTGRK